MHSGEKEERRYSTLLYLSSIVICYITCNLTVYYYHTLSGGV